MSNKKIKKFQKYLLKWINKKDENGTSNYRDYPWRRSGSPYEVLITEIMLQKTNSEKVAELFPLFFKKFPTIQSVNKSKNNVLVKLLKPLGLQNEKAERIQLIAKKIVGEFGGFIPNDKVSLLKFKGIGEYIANATLCFAFKKKYELVDTNIVRIYKRIFNLKTDKKRARTDKKIWEFASRVLPEQNYGLYNFALLDFGAQICKARKPLCAKCFFIEDCCYLKK